MGPLPVISGYSARPYSQELAYIGFNGAAASNQRIHSTIATPVRKRKSFNGAAASNQRIPGRRDVAIGDRTSFNGAAASNQRIHGDGAALVREALQLQWGRCQ